MLLEETRAVLSLGKLCEFHGYPSHWSSGQKPHLTQNGKRIDCSKSNYVPFVVSGLPTSSSTTPTPTSSTSSSQDSVFFYESRYTENPVPERWESTSEELRSNLQHLPAQTKKWRTRRSTKWSVAWLALWLQDFGETFVDESRFTQRREHCQFFSWIANGFASKSGNGFGWVSTVSKRTFRRTQIAISPWRRNSQGLLAEDVLVQSCPERNILVTW